MHANWIKPFLLVAGAGLFLPACPSDDSSTTAADSTSTSNGEDSTTDGGPGPGTSADTTGTPGTTSTGEPGTSTGEPGTSTGEPGTSTGEPGTSTGEPGTSTGEPGTSTGEPGTSTGVEPGTSSGTTGGPVSACFETVDGCNAPADDCVCIGCNDNGVCGSDDDCVCADCAADDFCTGNCVDDGSCDPYLEGCACADCADLEICTNPPACGDGIVGPGEDCEGADLNGADCTTLGFTGGVLSCSDTCDFDTSACDAGGWLCNIAYYGTADGCDCGCGIIDPDCADASVASCDYCGDTGSCNEGNGCPGFIDAVDNSQCSGGLPAEWTCSPTYYAANDGCDCGCGAPDPDCVDATIESCDYCDDAGSCSMTACPGSIDPMNTATCI